MQSESQLIDRVQRRVSIPRGSGILLGIGDDCAIFRPRGSTEDLLFTTDLLTEDVHFRRATHRAEDAGWKALARGLSDIAAMGGDPRFLLISLAAAAWVDQRWIDGFYRGLLRLAAQAGVTLVGGDIGRSKKVVCDIIVCGAVPRGKALRRDGAHVGDAIYVSGRLGGSALGLATKRGAAWRCHLRPQPRLALGRFLRERVQATGAMDLSDGLSIDLARFAAASNVMADIETPPRFAGASLKQALHGGEDYELLFTAPISRDVPARFESIPLTRIGMMRRGRPGTVLLGGELLPPLGYDHFR